MRADLEAIDGVPLSGWWRERGGRFPPGEEVFLGDQSDAASGLLGLVEGGLGHLVFA